MLILKILFNEVLPSFTKRQEKRYLLESILKLNVSK